MLENKSLDNTEAENTELENKDLENTDLEEQKAKKAEELRMSTRQRLTQIAKEGGAEADRERKEEIQPLIDTADKAFQSVLGVLFLGLIIIVIMSFAG